MSENIKKLIVSIIICQLAGIIGGLFTSQTIPTWYQTIKKPAFTPPNWIFGPVWTLLYLLMGIALYLVWKSAAPGKAKALAVFFFFAQLALNVLWSFLFFFLKNPLAGFIDIIVLWISILVTILLFYPLSKVGSLLLVPYILWVTFASVLNYFLWQLNR
ncbi:MAG: tryptophan-rich sensory protein [Candidatus Aminicenantes bacterium]|nr:tryptophan-rich sensory protein [Candidatus Aminicenantes bacterium]